MDFPKGPWQASDYDNYRNNLKEQAEKEYKAFTQKIVTTKYQILGIRIPKLRKIAANISKGDIKSFLSLCKADYFEEVMLKGFVIALIKDEDFAKKQIENFIPLIDNWSINDSFCNSLKIANKNPQVYFPYFLSFLKEKEEYKIRVGLITILSFFVKEEYLDLILKEIDKIDSEKYYVNMAMAWLLCECYIKFPQKTEKYLLKNNLNDFTMNKTISKIRDSYRVSKEKKEFLNTLKRRKENEKNSK